MKISIVAGSHRHESESARVARYIEGTLRTIGADHTYPVVELRTSSYKNTRICYVPDHVIVRNVGQVLKGNQPADEHDVALRKRIEYSVRILMEYSKALQMVRSSGVIDHNSYPFGM